MLSDEKLHVIAVCSNPVRYNSRTRLFKEFVKEMMGNESVVLYLVEAAYGGRSFEVTDSQNPRHIQLRTTHEIWHKENMINIAMNRLPHHAKYIAWLDADISFTRPDWATETIQALQHHAIVQPWSHAIDLGPAHEVIGQAKSFCAYFSSGQSPSHDVRKYGYWHSGYAWAGRRDALEMLGGPLCGGPLIDFAPLGSADFYMAWSMIQRLEDNLYNDVESLGARKKGFTQPYIDALFQWQARAASLKLDLGVVPGTIKHFFHGRKKQRYYNTRENILINNEFNPHTDLRRSVDGLFQLIVHSPRQIKLRDELRRYFRQRNEDSIDLV